MIKGPYKKEIDRLQDSLETIQQKVSNKKLTYLFAKLETEKLLEDAEKTKELLTSHAAHKKVINKLETVINQIKQFIEDLSSLMEIKTTL